MTQEPKELLALLNLVETAIKPYSNTITRPSNSEIPWDGISLVITQVREYLEKGGGIKESSKQGTISEGNGLEDVGIGKIRTIPTSPSSSNEEKEQSGKI